MPDVGDIVVADFPGARGTKRRPTVVISSLTSMAQQSARQVFHLLESETLWELVERVHRHLASEAIEHAIVGGVPSACTAIGEGSSAESMGDLDIKARDGRHQALFTDQMAVHILELPKFAKTVEQLATPLDRWMFFLRNARELDVDALPTPLDVPEVRSALGDLIMISQSKRHRELYESREKMQRDVYTALAEAEDLGEARGLEKGRAEGRRAHIEYLQRLLCHETVPQERLQELSLPELDDLAGRLQTELDAKLANGQ